MYRRFKKTLGICRIEKEVFDPIDLSKTLLFNSVIGFVPNPQTEDFLTLLLLPPLLPLLPLSSLEAVPELQGLPADGGVLIGEGQLGRRGRLPAMLLGGGGVLSATRQGKIGVCNSSKQR